MQFSAPSGIQFEIPDEWWTCADMDKFTRKTNFYIYPSDWVGVQIALLSEIVPPTRTGDVPLLKKYRLVPILCAFQSPDESALPPIEVQSCESHPFRFKVHNGCHRYYASIAAGFSHIPVVVIRNF